MRGRATANYATGRTPSTLTLAPGRSGVQRQAGRATRLLAGGTAASAILPPVLLWLAGGWSAGQAVALFACLLLLGAMALHIADHVADFLNAP